jgi:hypothetical protein
MRSTAQHRPGRDHPICKGEGQLWAYGGSDAHVKPLKTDSPTSVNFVLGRLLHPRTATVHGCMFQVASRAIDRRCAPTAEPICLLGGEQWPSRVHMGHGSRWSKI